MRWLAYLASLAGGLAVGVIVLVTAWSVFARYILHSPLTWIEEISGLLMMWIVLVSAIACEARNENLTIDLLERALPPTAQKILFRAVSLASVGLLGVLGWQGWKLAASTAFRKTQMLGVPFFWIYLAFCVGAGGLIIVTVMRLFMPPLESDDVLGSGPGVT